MHVSSWPCAQLSSRNFPQCRRRYIFEGKANILPGIMRKLGGAFDLVVHCKCSERLVREPADQTVSSD